MAEKMNIALVNETTETQTKLREMREVFINEGAPAKYIKRLQDMILEVENMYFELTYPE